MLPRNQRQEVLSRAYVRAATARAGVLCFDSTQDFGIDLFLRAVTARKEASLMSRLKQGETP
jgi:hypothetical protein